MVAIRLRRAGSKKRPYFRIVVTDSRAARDSCAVHCRNGDKARLTDRNQSVRHHFRRHMGLRRIRGILQIQTGAKRRAGSTQD